MRLDWLVNQEADGSRLDVFLTTRAEITRSRAGALIREGQACVDGTVETKAGFRLKMGMSVVLTIPDARVSETLPQSIPLSIVYQDDDLAVVYKPSGMVVHPAVGNPDRTMVNALLYQLDGLSGIGGEARPGIVHRIDKDTSGLLLVAKNDKSHVALSAQIKAHTVERAYLAIVQGNLKQDEGSVDAPIARHPRDRKKMAVVQGGREALTQWRVLERLKCACFIEARLTTGRTHQIRVHMASIGHPVLGDAVYGPSKMPYPVENGQLLHARTIGFEHPTSGEWMRFSADPEPRFTKWLEKLRIL